MIRWNIATSILSVVLVGLIAGCSASRSDLQLTSTRTGEKFVNNFPVGVAEVHDDGVTDLVLTCRTAGTTAECPAVDQMLHVRVLWRQGHAIKSQNRLASENAVLHWYITPAGDQEMPTNAMLEYRGTGLVRMERSGDQVVLNIEQATLSPTAVSGNMADHLGLTNITGTLTARLNPEQTSSALGELRAALAAARTADGPGAHMTIGE